MTTTAAPPAKRSTLAAFQSAAFSRMWAGGFVSNVGTWMQATALGYYTADLTKSAFWTALVAAGEFAPTALLGPVGGAIADRWSRKAIFMTVTVIQGLLATALTITMMNGRPGAPVIALYALANGCTFALGFPAFQSVLPDLVDQSALSSAIGLSSASWNFGRVVGPMLTALLHSSIGITGILAINAASFGAVVAALLTIRIPARVASTTRLLAAIKDGFRFVAAEPGLRVMIQSLAWNTLWLAPFIGLIPAMVEKEFGGGQREIAWLITAQGAGAVCTGLLFAKAADRFGVRRVMVFAMSTLPVSLTAYALAPNAGVAVVPMFVTGLLYFAALSSFSNIAQLRAPTEYRGRVLSTNQVVLGSFYAIALGIQGTLGDALNGRVVTIGTALIALGGLLVMRIVRPGYATAVETS